MKKVAIIGGGASSLVLAYFLGDACEVTIYEKEKSIGRKFLVAGKGGFNLTNSLDGKDLMAKYSSENFLKKAIAGFGSVKTRDWLSDLGVVTYVGSSGRVFPEKGVKPIEVLDAIRLSLSKKRVEIKTNHQFVGFDKIQNLIIKNKDKEYSLTTDFVVFAMGGASWKQTGSDGNWLSSFEELGVICKPFQSSNCGVNVSWEKELLRYHEGKPLKNISVTLNEKTVVGEVLLTAYGLEGNAIYPIVPEVRKELNKGNTPLLEIDFKPTNNLKQLNDKLFKGMKTKDYERVFRLSKPQMAVLKAYTTKEEFVNTKMFIEKLKKLVVPIDSLRPIDEAISTVGGVALEGVNEDFSLKKRSDFFVAGEMIDWDAPTGGFLLQGCFSTAHLVAHSILNR